MRQSWNFKAINTEWASLVSELTVCYTTYVFILNVIIDAIDKVQCKQQTAEHWAKAYVVLLLLFLNQGHLSLMSITTRKKRRRKKSSSGGSEDLDDNEADACTWCPPTTRQLASCSHSSLSDPFQYDVYILKFCLHWRVSVVRDGNC